MYVIVKFVIFVRYKINLILYSTVHYIIIYDNDIFNDFTMIDQE